jgi:DnaJ-class molecular chaperone
MKYLVLAAVGIAAAVGYVIACAFWPFAACRRCTGSGKRRSPSGKAWRKCRRCRGSGERLRTGRRVWNYFAQMRREADSGR